jgi:5'-3' exonuclease
MKKIIIIDGHNFLWRAYSVPFEFYSKKNTPLHVTTMYLKLTRRAISSIKGFSKRDSVVVVFDTNTTNDNKELLKEYKANRKKFSKGEESPYSHIPHVQKALNFLNIKYLEIPNIEADDIIASISRSFCKKVSTNKSYIVSADTDFYQLLNKQTHILKLEKGEEYEIIKSKHVKERFGVTPKQYINFKSLTGDSADNIKGVTGVGKITAKKIVCKEIDFKINEHKEMLDLNKKLITLNCNCKKQWNFRDFSYKPDIFDISNKDIFKYCKF